jgi:hypothetical protein
MQMPQLVMGYEIDIETQEESKRHRFVLISLFLKKNYVNLGFYTNYHKYYICKLPLPS